MSKLTRDELWQVVQDFKTNLTNSVADNLSATTFNANNTVSKSVKYNEEIFKDLKNFKPYDYNDSSNLSSKHKSTPLEIMNYLFLSEIYDNQVFAPNVYEVISTTAMLALSGVNKADIAIVSGISKTYINKTGNNNSLSDWALFLNSVSSISGGTGGGTVPSSLYIDLSETDEKLQVKYMAPSGTVYIVPIYNPLET
jgi:hypothetical protein